MTIGSEVLTSTIVMGGLTAVLGYFIRRWMERIETKVDSWIERNGEFITRKEYERGMNRVHQRVDEHIAEHQEISSRVAWLEGQTKN